MKKQNVNNKLAFGKATVTELNNSQMNHVQGGSRGNSSWECIGQITRDYFTFK